MLMFQRVQLRVQLSVAFHVLGFHPMYLFQVTTVPVCKGGDCWVVPGCFLLQALPNTYMASFSMCLSSMRVTSSLCEDNVVYLAFNVSSSFCVVFRSSLSKAHLPDSFSN